MAKIIKVGSQNPTFTSQNSNPAKTSRAGNITNPFKFTNFEGNTLQFADVFEGFDSKKSNNISFKGADKLRMIASSATGTMNKIKSSIPESIINFVNRVRGGISSAWDYAKNTNVSDLGAVKAFNNLMNTEITMPSVNMSGITNSISNIGKGISSHFEFLNRDVMDLGKEVSEKWSGLISKINHNHISAETPVSELETLWKNEIAMSGEAA